MNSSFSTTRWTLVLDAGRKEGDEAAGELFLRYWQPLYRYARRCGKGREDAEDLVQGFSVHFLRSEVLEKADRTRGRFRTWLLSSFKHWMVNEWKRSCRLKRRAECPTLSFDWRNGESGLDLQAWHGRSPDFLYDRDWTLAILDKVLGDLEGICRSEGNSHLFASLKPCLIAASGSIDYPSLAASLGMTEGAARVAVHRLRKRYRAVLSSEIVRTLGPSVSVEEEVRALLVSLAI